MHISTGYADTVRPRERILAAACELFYQHGIHVVSVDQVAEAAESNKMTLYRHFKSKDDLVAACMSEAAKEWHVFWREVEEAHCGDPKGQLVAWLEGVVDRKTNPEDRGCALANVAVQIPQPDHPARCVIEDTKWAMREKLVKLCEKAAFPHPEQFADEVYLLLEGAGICSQSTRTRNLSLRIVDIVKARMAEQEKQLGPT